MADVKEFVAAINTDAVRVAFNRIDDADEVADELDEFKKLVSEIDYDGGVTVRKVINDIRTTINAFGGVVANIQQNAENAVKLLIHMKSLRHAVQKSSALEACRSVHVALQHKLRNLEKNAQPYAHQKPGFTEGLNKLLELVADRIGHLTDGTATLKNIKDWKSDASQLLEDKRTLFRWKQAMDWGIVSALLKMLSDAEEQRRNRPDDSSGVGGGGDDDDTVHHCASVAANNKKIATIDADLARYYADIPCPTMAVVQETNVVSVLTHARLCLRKQKLEACNTVQQTMEERDIDTIVSEHNKFVDELEKQIKTITNKIHTIKDRPSVLEKGNIHKQVYRATLKCGAGITEPSTAALPKKPIQFAKLDARKSDHCIHQAQPSIEDVMSMLKLAHPSVTLGTHVTSLDWVALNCILKQPSLETEGVASRIVAKIHDIIATIITTVHADIKHIDITDICKGADKIVCRNIYLKEVPNPTRDEQKSTLNLILSKLGKNAAAETIAAVNICFGLWIATRVMSPVWNFDNFEKDITPAEDGNLPDLETVRATWMDITKMAPVHRRALCAAHTVSSSTLKVVFIPVLGEGVDINVAIHTWPSDHIDSHEWIRNVIAASQAMQTPMAITPMGILTIPPFQTTEAYTASMIDLDHYKKYMANATDGKVREFAIRLTFWLLLNTQFHRLSLERRIHLCLALCIPVPPLSVLNSRMDVPFVYQPFVDLLHIHIQRPCDTECVRLINWFWGNALNTASIHEMVVENLCKSNTVLPPDQCMRWALTNANFQSMLVDTVGDDNRAHNYECANYKFKFTDTATNMQIAMRYHAAMTALSSCDTTEYFKWIQIHQPTASNAYGQEAHTVVRGLPRASLDVLRNGTSLVTVAVQELWLSPTPTYVVAPESVSAMIAHAVDTIVMPSHTIQTSGRAVTSHILSTGLPTPVSYANTVSSMLRGHNLAPYSMYALLSVVGVALAAHSSDETPYFDVLKHIFSNRSNCVIDAESSTIKIIKIVDMDSAAIDLKQFHIQDGWDAFGQVKDITAVFATNKGSHGCLCVSNKAGDVRVVRATATSEEWSNPCVRDHVLANLAVQLHGAAHK